MSSLTTSVLIPSFRRPAKLIRCLQSLSAQAVKPNEVLVVWQGEDIETRAAAESYQGSSPYPLAVYHSPSAGIVPAENVALQEARGDIVLLIDDDAVANRFWIKRHLKHYRDPGTGAVGGPVNTYYEDGTPFPRRKLGKLGRVTWYGKFIGGACDLLPMDVTVGPLHVDHLMGSNFSFRRQLISQFEAHLRPYWNFFEVDACLQIKKRGFRILFDLANTIEHWPEISNARVPPPANVAYNHALVLGKHSNTFLRLPRLGYCLLVGSSSKSPGLAFAFANLLRGRARLAAECKSLGLTWQAALRGWGAGARIRRRKRTPERSGN